MSVKAFICYAREDEPLVSKLKLHLVPLQRQGLIDLWYDRDISAGMDWAEEIDKRLNSAQIILLMISPDFMSSDYCYGVELAQAIMRHKDGQAYIIPIILRPATWRGFLGKFQALPKDGKPVKSRHWRNIDEALSNVSEGIGKLIDSLPQEFLSDKSKVDVTTPAKDEEDDLIEGIATKTYSPEEIEEIKQKLSDLPTALPILSFNTGRLYIKAGKGQGQFYPIRRSLSIGRDRDSDIFLEDLAASRKHASVSRVGTQYLLEDIGSANGTRLNGHILRKGEQYPLSAGDEILIGQIILVFE